MASEQRGERRLVSAFRDLREFIKENEQLCEFITMLPNDVDALRKHVEQLDSIALVRSIVDALGRQSDGWKKLINDAIPVPKKRKDRGALSLLNMAAVEHFIENEITFIARGKMKEHLSKIATIKLNRDGWLELFDLLETIYDEIANGETELSEVEDNDIVLLPKREFVEK